MAVVSETGADGDWDGGEQQARSVRDCISAKLNIYLLWRSNSCCRQCLISDRLITLKAPGREPVSALCFWQLMAELQNWQAVPLDSFREPAFGNLLISTRQRHLRPYSQN